METTRVFCSRLRKAYIQQGDICKAQLSRSSEDSGGLLTGDLRFAFLGLAT